MSNPVERQSHQEPQIAMDDGSPASSLWVDTALSLDDLHQNPDSRLMKADIEPLDHQQQPSLASPTTMLSFDTLLAFLDGMGQLEDGCADVMSNVTCTQRENAPKMTTSAFSCDAQQGQKKTKLSSSQRARRTKLVLEETIAKLQQQVARITQAQREQFSYVDERWKPVIRQEKRYLKRVMAARRRLHQAVDMQRKTAIQLQDLMRQWTNLMQFYPSVQLSRTLQSADARDAAIFAMLDRNVELKYQLLHEQMRLTDASAASTREFEQTSLSADNQTMDVYCLRLVPFNVDQISAIAWRWGKHEFDGCHFEQAPKAMNTHTLKQELVISPPSHDAMKLTLRAVCKRFVTESYTALYWEGTCDWSTLTDSRSSRRTTTRESGWVIFRPIEISPPISAVQAFVQVSPSDAREPWMQFMQQRSVLAKVILPSSEQAMIERHQSVENQLVDAASKATERSLNSPITV